MRWGAGAFLFVVLTILSSTGRVAAAPADDQDSFALQVFDLTNAERQKAGLAPLRRSVALEQAAQNYSEILVTSGCFDHTCGPVPDFADRVGRAGYTHWTAIGENIAAGYSTPEAVVEGWMASPGHRANILSPRFTEVGIGLTSSDGRYGTYWTEEFGARPDAHAADDGSSG